MRVSSKGERAPAQLALFRVHACLVKPDGDSPSVRVEVRPKKRDVCGQAKPQQSLKSGTLADGALLHEWCRCEG